MLLPYWIDCVDAPGVGITAQSQADALALFKNAFGSSNHKAKFGWKDNVRLSSAYGTG